MPAVLDRPVSRPTPPTTARARRPPGPAARPDRVARARASEPPCACWCSRRRSPRRARGLVGGGRPRRRGPRAGRAVRAARAAETCPPWRTGPSRPGRSCATRDPALPETARRLVVASLEAVAGVRPLVQLSRALSPEVMEELRGAARRAPVAGPPPQVRSVRVSEPALGVAEASAVVRDRGRVLAVALRLERWRGRWRCTALEIG